MVHFIKNLNIVTRLVSKEVGRFEQPVLERYKNPYKVLISCLLSLRTKDAVTAKAARNLFKMADNPYSMVELARKQVEQAVYPVGFYKTKTKRILDISRILIERYGGKVPDSERELLGLKGVGRKTCNIVLLHAYGRYTLPIDTHCHRIPNRLGWIDTKTPEESEVALKKILPKKYWKDFNRIFVTFGQNICLPVRPRCESCSVFKYCDFGPKFLRSLKLKSK